MTFPKKPKKSNKPFPSLQYPNLTTTLLIILLLFTTTALLLLLRSPAASVCTTTTADIKPKFSGDLRSIEFSWNHLEFRNHIPSPVTLKIAVFSRKWPVGPTPGGMERHAYTLYTALANRGHEVHVITSPPINETNLLISKHINLHVHYHEGEPGRWRYDKAWDVYLESNEIQPFDIVHSESVALPHWRARKVANLVVTWHGIALESVHSDIYQELAHGPHELIYHDFESTVQGSIPKVVDEIRFFKSYTHHIAISDSCGDILRDVYQIPTRNVHVIVNGVDEAEFRPDPILGQKFRDKIGIPRNATLVLGVSGRLVRDKGHPLLYKSFSNLKHNHPNVYLVVAGDGPWRRRYEDLGYQVIALGSMNPSDLTGFYNGIDLFVNPTLRPQGLDLTLMEAMMSKKAIVATRFPSIKGTVMINDEFGHMFSPNVESLTETLELAIKEGRKRLAERGNACREYAASMFTAEKMALAYERLFLCIKNATYCVYP